MLCRLLSSKIIDITIRVNMLEYISTLIHWYSVLHFGKAYKNKKSHFEMQKLHTNWVKLG